MKTLLLEQSATQNYWDDHWEKTTLDKLIKYMHLYKQYKIVIANIKKGRKILEGGCGLSQWVYKLNELGFDISGVDYAPKTVENINKIYPQLDIKVGNVENLEIENSSIATYLSWGVIEHFENGSKKSLDEAYRVLENGGKLIVSVPYQNPLITLLYKDKKELGMGEFFQYLFSKKDFVNALENSGFKIKEIHYQNWILGVLELRTLIKNGYIPNSQYQDSGSTTTNSLRELIKRLIIKISDCKILSYFSGHMILIVAEKDEQKSSCPQKSDS